MADPDYSGWTLQPASPAPNEYAGWTLQPVAQPQPPPAQPTIGQAILRGGAQGGTLGFADESAGTGAFLGALAQKYGHLPQAIGGEGYGGSSNDAINPVEAYKEARDEYRAKDAAAQKAHPLAFGGAQFAASIPTAFVPGLGAGREASLARTLLTSTAAGGLAGLGSSTSDTVGGDALSALAGAGIGLGAGALGVGAGKLASKAADKLRTAWADQAQLINKAAQKTFRQARSSVGGETAAVLQAHEQAMKIAANEGGIFTPEMVAAAKSKLADPAFQDIVRNAAQNSLDAGADRLSGSLATAKNALESAKQGISPEAINSATEDAMKHPIRTQVLPRMQHYAQRALPIAVGTGIGGAPGAVVGGVTAAALGHPGTSMANMLRSPAFRGLYYGATGGLERGAAKVTPMLAGGASLALSPEIQAMVSAIRSRNPDYSQWTLEDQQP